jgi:hypothetical protein
MRIIDTAPKLASLSFIVDSDLEKGLKPNFQLVLYLHSRKALSSARCTSNIGSEHDRYDARPVGEHVAGCAAEEV